MDDATTAIPAANNINLFSRDTTDNNDNGIQTTADPDNGDNAYIELTNRTSGSATTVGATTENVITFDCGGTAGAYKFHIELIAFESATPEAGGYSIEATARTTGAAATIVATPDADEDEDTNLEMESSWDVVASGNNVLVQVIGYAGATINWKAVLTYTFVS